MSETHVGTHRHRDTQTASKQYRFRFLQQTERDSGDTERREAENSNLDLLSLNNTKEKCFDFFS